MKLAETCQVYSHDVNEKCINSQNILEFLRQPEVTGHYKKIPPLYLGKNLLATAGNLKVDEQTKYNSVPIFLLFLAVERKPEIQNFLLNF